MIVHTPSATRLSPCTPTVDANGYIRSGTRTLFCLNVADGSVLWSKQFLKDFNLKNAPVWALHLIRCRWEQADLSRRWSGIDGCRFRQLTGNELWRAVDSTTAHGPGYGPPQIIEHNGHRILLAFHPAV